MCNIITIYLYKIKKQRYIKIISLKHYEILKNNNYYFIKDELKKFKK